MKKGFAVLLVFVAVMVSFRQTGSIEQIATEFEHVLYTRQGEVVVSRADVVQARSSHEVVAEAIRFLGDEQDALTAIREFSARVVRTETVAGAHIIYAYTPRLTHAKTLSFGTFNLMLAVREGVVTAATPIIYGSY